MWWTSNRYKHKTVFLRILEYYPGILVLTTNRAGDFDEALKSRIHVSLNYPPIREEGTLQIWQNNMAKLSSIRPDMRMDRDALMAYAAKLYKHQQSHRQTTWNGRQITNAFQSAIALATFNAPSGGRPKLTTEHFRKISETTEQFEEYLLRINGATDEHLATERRSRHSNDLDVGRGDAAVPRSRLGFDSQSDREQSDLSSAESSDSEGPVRYRGHPDDYNPPGLESGPPPAPSQRSIRYGHPYQTPSQSPAAPFPQQAFSSPTLPQWSQQMQQPVIVPAGMFYAGTHSQQPVWPIPSVSTPSSFPHQQSRFPPIPSTPSDLPAFNPFGVSTQDQTQTRPPLSVPGQPVQPNETKLEVPNLVSNALNLHQINEHIMDLLQRRHAQLDAQLPSSRSASATKDGNTRKTRARESKRPGSHMSQGGGQARWPSGNDDEGFWSQLKRDS